MRSERHRLFGVDLTTVPGISALTAHALLAEVGPDLSRFPSAAAFASWLALCPGNKKAEAKSCLPKPVPPIAAPATLCASAPKPWHAATPI